MEQDPVSVLTRALEQCAEADVTVSLVFRCSVNKLPKEQKDTLINQVVQVEGISPEEAEARLDKAATTLSMTNASPEMGANALLAMIAENNMALGRLANNVLQVDEQRLREAQEGGAETETKIITPG